MTEYGNKPALPTGVGGGGLQLADQPAVNPCEPLRLLWLAAQRLCDEARARQNAAEKEKARDTSELESLEKQFPDLGGGAEGANVDGEEFTFNDLRLLKRAAKSAFERYQANPSPETARAAQSAGRQGLTPEMRDQLRREQADAEARMRQLRDEIAADQAELEAATAKATQLCDDATNARKAYEECVRARSGPPPPPVAPPPAGSNPTPETATPDTPTPEEPSPTPDDPRDTHDDDPRDLQPCPPGSEEWQRCSDKVEYFDWQRDDATVRLEIRPAVGSVYGWLQTWSRGYSAPAASQSFECDVPQRALEIDLYRNSPHQTASSMFRDLNAVDMLHKTWFVSIRATFTYVRSGWVCERRCQDGKWIFRAVEVGRKEMTKVFEPEPFLNSTDPGANTAAIAKMLKPIGEFAAALYLDYLNQDSFQVSCRQGVVCAGEWERAGLDDVAKPRR